MKLRHVFFGLGTLIAAPIAAAVGYVYTVGYKVTKTAYRYPMTTAVALTTASVLWYNGCRDPEVRGSVVTSAHSVVESVRQSLDRREEVADLERRLVDADTRNQSLLAEYRAYVERSSVAQRPPPAPAPAASPNIPSAPAPVLSSTPPPPQAPVAPLREDGFYFYYVKPGETLSRIAQDLTGSAMAYRAIAQDNRLQDPDRITAGMLLRIRASLCARPHAGLYEQVPALDGVLLRGGASIRERFGERAASVLELNRALGLAYDDAAPGLDARVVYVPPDHR